MSEDKNTNMFSNAKLSTIFLVVLGLHVVVIVLISAYHLLKGDTTIDVAEHMSDPEPRSYESVFKTDDNGQVPYVETQRSSQETEVATAEEPQPVVPMSMPSADDPIWTGQAPAVVKAQPKAPVQQPITQQPQSNFRPAPVQQPAVPKVAPKVTKISEVEQPLPKTSVTTYQVQKGDTLSGIASRFGVSVTEIQNTNQLSSTMIRVGQNLSVPGFTQAAAIAPTPAPKVPAPRAEVVSANSRYQVAKGDTLWRIAKKFNTTPDQLVKLNGLKDPSKLKVGEVLTVPSAGIPSKVSDMAMVPTS
ncbi:MAG: LysM peptidoglycan-binding domain-containing protein [Verrucomicrobiota bacterium]